MSRSYEQREARAGACVVKVITVTMMCVALVGDVMGSPLTPMQEYVCCRKSEDQGYQGECSGVMMSEERCRGVIEEVNEAQRRWIDEENGRLVVGEGQ